MRARMYSSSRTERSTELCQVYCTDECGDSDLCVCVCVCAGMRACVHAGRCSWRGGRHVLPCMRACACVCARACVCIYACMQTCIAALYTHTHAHAHRAPCTHVHTQAHACGGPLKEHKPDRHEYGNDLERKDRRPAHGYTCQPIVTVKELSKSCQRAVNARGRPVKRLSNGCRRVFKCHGL